jgi:hypothetical protein
MYVFCLFEFFTHRDIHYTVACECRRCQRTPVANWSPVSATPAINFSQVNDTGYYGNLKSLSPNEINRLTRLVLKELSLEIKFNWIKIASYRSK